MKRLACILLFIITKTVIAQPPNENELTCDDGIRKAIEDVNKGEYFLAGYGLIVADNKWWEERDFKDKYLSENYNIHLWVGGCVVTEANQCYSDTMVKLYERKFGSGFFDSVNPIIKAKYNEFIESRINSDYVFINALDTMPELKYNPEFISEYISMRWNDSIPIPEGRVYIRFTVMKDKTTKDFEVQQGLHPHFDRICLEVAQGIEVIRPAIYYGREVNCYVLFPINFVASDKKK